MSTGWKERLAELGLGRRRRAAAPRGTPAEAVTPAKRRKLLSAARAWLAENPPEGSREVRFDVVAIEGGPEKIDWIKGAFDAT